MTENTHPWHPLPMLIGTAMAMDVDDEPRSCSCGNYRVEKTPNEYINVFRTIDRDVDPLALMDRSGYSVASPFSNIDVGEDVLSYYVERKIATIPPEPRIDGWSMTEIPDSIWGGYI